jgi:adenylate cyclase
MPDTASPSPLPPLLQSFDAPLGRKIIELHVWAVGEGLRGTEAAALFDSLCQHLVNTGVPLSRGFAGMRTLHPQWAGYTYTWRRDLNAIRPAQLERGDEYEQQVGNSPFGHLSRQAETSAGDGGPWLHLRRRLRGAAAQLDFPMLAELAAAGATDYFAELVRFGADGDPSWGSGIGYSFATDRLEGFHDDDLVLLKAVLPVVSLAMMTHAGHTIASGLLTAYLGADAGRRVHAGAVERGTVENIRAVLWYADIRTFTAIADTTPGAVVIELLDEIFETLTASLRPRGGEVLKFLGDGMLAIFPFEDATREHVCHRALEAAAEAMRAINRLNAARARCGQTGCRGRLGPSSRRGVVRQRRRCRPTRFHGDRAGGQRSRAHRGTVRTFGPQCAGLSGVCRSGWRQRPPRTSGPSHTARRARDAGNLRPRSRLAAIERRPLKGTKHQISKSDRCKPSGSCLRCRWHVSDRQRTE